MCVEAGTGTELLDDLDYQACRIETQGGVRPEAPASQRRVEGQNHTGNRAREEEHSLIRTQPTSESAVLSQGVHVADNDSTTLIQTASEPQP